MHYHPADTGGAPPQEVVRMGNEITMTSKQDNVPIVADLIKKEMELLSWPKEKVENFEIALTEAVNNAMFHGNFGLRKEELGEGYDNAKVQAEKKHGGEKKVSITIEEMSATRVSVVVTDEGEGFDHESLPDPTAPENLLKESGRGVFLMRSLGVEVTYLEKGNKVQLETTRAADEATS